MTADDADRVAEIERLLALATPGPWIVRTDEATGWPKVAGAVKPSEKRDIVCVFPLPREVDTNPANAALIVLLVNNAAALVQSVREVERERDEAIRAIGPDSFQAKQIAALQDAARGKWRRMADDFHCGETWEQYAHAATSRAEAAEAEVARLRKIEAAAREYREATDAHDEAFDLCECEGREVRPNTYEGHKPPCRYLDALKRQNAAATSLDAALPAPTKERAPCDVCDGRGEVATGCSPECQDGDKEYPCDLPHARPCPSPSCTAPPTKAQGEQG